MEYSANHDPRCACTVCHQLDPDRYVPVLLDVEREHDKDKSELFMW